MSSHRFTIGQLVCLKSGLPSRSASKETYRVTATLPARDNSLQYRIRSDVERYERVMTEDLLVKAGTQEDATSVFRN